MFPRRPVTAGPTPGGTIRPGQPGSFLPQLVGLLALLLPLLTAVGAVPAAGPETFLDLLEQQGIPEPASADAPRVTNPHAMECEECHLPTTGTALVGPLPQGDDTVGLCLRCHQGDNLHPVGISLPAGRASGGDLGLPLGGGTHEGEITCLTCHYLHARDHRRNLLRGDEEPGRSRRDRLCSRCHAEKLKGKSPHEEGGGDCGLCHMSPPREGEGQRLDPNLQTVCNFCHDALANRHYASVNPFIDEDIRSRTSGAGLPLLEGRFTCVSCHDPHASGGRRKLLREVYLGLASYSRSINPHWKDVMCVSCHEGEPSKGNPRLGYGGDRSFICNRCHAGTYSRHDIHPVNVIPSAAVAVPKDMPLHDGRVTCETCHDSSLQEGGERRLSAGRTNPRFLRGGFTTRGEFCLRCHLREQYRLLDPHRQLDERGSLRVLACLFCHSSLPDTSRAGIESVHFDEESLNDLCVLCHGEAYLRRHPDTDHLVRPSRKVQEAMDTSVERVGIDFPLADGAIVCVTCHNPHQEGVIKDEARPRRPRLAAGREVCRGCHQE